MDRLPSSVAGWRRIATRLGLAGLPLLGAGCVDGAVAWLTPPPPAAQATPDILLTAHAEPAVAPDTTAPPPTPLHEADGNETTDHVVPLSIDTVLRLADEQNLRVEQARAKVQEAIAQQDLACRWLPELYVGVAYYRHEGGIQNEDGTLIRSSTGAILGGVDLHGKFDPRELAYQQVNAERKAHQEKAELERLTSEKLLDAATTYIDLLAAQAGKAINRDLQKELNGLLERAQKLADINVGEAQVAVPRFKAELEGLKRQSVYLDAQASAASAKLIYLLGLDPCSKVLPMDGDLVPFDLVPARPLCDLIAEAQAHGPGIQELSALVGLIEDALQKAKGPSRFLPVFELRATEGGFGAGFDSNLTWANRFDAGLQMRWNLTDLATRCERGRIADAQRAQAHFAYEDLRAKLTAGVTEAHDTIVAGNAQIGLSQEQIRHAREAQRVSRELQEKALPDGIMKMFDSLAALGQAQLNYLNAVRDYDKAQIRLLVLLGHGDASCP
jgi:outer membrane protein TolC